MSTDRVAAGDEPARHGQEEPQPAPTGPVGAVPSSLEAAQAADETGASTRVIAILAVLATGGVRREMLHAAGQAGVLTSGGRRMTAAAVDDVLAMLAERSLLTTSPDGRVGAPRLVAAQARSWLAGQGQLVTACQAAAAMLETRARTLDASRDRPAARDFSEQVAALLGSAAGSAAGPAGRAGQRLAEDLLRLRFLALYYLIELGDSVPQAVAAGESLTADLERMLGPDHPDTLNARNSLAAAYLAAGRPAEAVPLFERTLVGRERMLGPNDPDTLTSQNNLAAAYQDDGRVGEAILLLRLTLAARERLLGAGHPDTLSSRGNLAAAYRLAGRTAEAIPLLEQTLAGRERVLGPGHPDTRAARQHLEQAHQDAARPAAEPPPIEPGPPAAEPATVELPAVQLPAADLPAAELPPPVIEDLPAEPEPEPEPEEAAAWAGNAADEQAAARRAAAEEAVLEELLSGEPDVPGEPSPAPATVPAPAAAAVPGVPRPRPPAGADQPAGRSRGRGPRLPWMAAAALVLIVASGAAGALSRLHSGDHSRGPAGAARTRPANAAQMAADWVSQEVSHSVTVACDPLMCAALEARGVPPARLLVLRTGAASPRGAGVIVATPAVRSQFGSRLDSEYAPLVLAGFGSGPGQVNVQVVAPDGAAAYRAALRQDQASRKAAGLQLLANKQIGVTSAARAQLAAGAVDSRLLILLPALAATHPVRVLAFGGAGPEAGAGTPLSSVDLSGSGQAAGMADAAYQRWLTSFVRAQLAHFSGSVTVVRQGGQAVVRIQFARPSPLGLLA
ncbi:MAG TPA: tetratricopeptide repeat protein [Streptosporangiaceae bacterium]|nr:tetratricopeptide repeat protein [Streptosporangiaceae bacterium]